MADQSSLKAEFGANFYTIEPLHDGHLGDRDYWPLYNVGGPGGGGGWGWLNPPHSVFLLCSYLQGLHLGMPVSNNCSVILRTHFDERRFYTTCDVDCKNSRFFLAGLLAKARTAESVGGVDTRAPVGRVTLAPDLSFKDRAHLYGQRKKIRIFCSLLEMFP